MQLSNSEGLGEIIVFEGLSHSLIIHPTIHGEPLLTAQPFYYLEQLESVAQIRFESDSNPITNEKLEYLVDNYLFEYSKRNPKSKISTKAIAGKYWAYDTTNAYAFYDERHTEALVLDRWNDPSVHEIKALDTEDDSDFTDWCLVKNYSDPLFHSYLEGMSKLLDKKIFAIVSPSEERDGFMGKSRLLKIGGDLLTLYQAEQIDGLTMRDIKPDMTSIKVRPGPAFTLESMPVNRVNLTKEYNPVMLSYYFSGLKEFNPLLSFIGFYNAIEYYFEEAPLQLGKTAKTELEQIKCVIEILATNGEISSFIANDFTIKNSISKNIETSSQINIRGFSPTSGNDYISELGRWLYDIRCAVIHSKKTRRGQKTPAFNPYSSHADNMKTALPVIKWLAILCIEKDFELTGTPSINNGAA